MSAQQLITEHIDLWTSSIKAKNTQGRGSSKKRELYGIKKLRELILELAVRGKLVPQDPNDEPASVLLERIGIEKEQLIKDKKIKKQKPLPAITDEEKPFYLPNGWEWIRLGEATNYGSSDKIEAKDADSNTWILELEDVEKETSKLLKKVRFDDREYKSSKNKFYKGDVLYGKLRPYLDKVLVADENGVCTTEMIPIRAHACISSNHLRLIMKSPYFKEYANSSTHGMSLPRMGTDKARLALIPVVPEMEQHRIVAKVDELMALCDQLEQQTESSLDAHNLLVDTLLATLTDARDAKELGDNWARLADHFDTLITTDYAVEHLKQTILQLAVMGKLVPQDPNDEPASELLKRIAAEKAQLMKAKKLKPQKKAEHYEAPIEFNSIPDGWITADFGDITFNRDAERIPLSVSDRRSRQGQYNYYGASSVIDSIDEYLFDKPLLLIGEDGANLVNRSTPIAFMASGKYWVNNHAHVIDGISEEFLIYLGLYINSISLLPFITGMAQPKMNQAKMNSILVALPPEKEQVRIIKKLETLWIMCDQLNVQLNDTQITLIQLTDAVVYGVVDEPTKSSSPDTQGVKNMKITTMLTLNIDEVDEGAVIAPLILEMDGSADAKDIWAKTKLTLPEFYEQLKIEIDAGYILKPARAEFEEV